jgi:large subunit ribosomal protein L15e
MGAYKYIRQSIASMYKARSPALRSRLTAWRSSPTVARVEKPANLIRARELGYKAKRDYIVARVRIAKGKRARPRYSLGRKPAKTIKYVSPGFSAGDRAELKAANRFSNLKVLGSYYVGEDGTDKYYEVVMLNPNLASRPKAVTLKKKA